MCDGDAAELSQPDKSNEPSNFSLSAAILNTVDFVHPSGAVVFRTTAEEKDKVIFQMVRGGANA